MVCYLLCVKINIQKELEDNILPNLTRETCLILNDNHKKLEQLTWSEGENNKDVPFSELAKECCLEAFLKINKVKNLKLSIDIPDLKLNFEINKKTIKKKIELKSTLKGIIPGSARSKFDPNIWTISRWKHSHWDCKFNPAGDTCPRIWLKINPLTIN